MKERPILFSASMVRAILDDRKIKTRRVVKPQPDTVVCPPATKGEFLAVQFTPDDEFLGRLGKTIPCPYGQPGDRLWVKETYFAFGRWETRYSAKKGRDEWHFIDMTTECDRAYQYDADNPDIPLASRHGALPGWHKRPSIFMPRSASRILLKVTDVRVERLNDISEADAVAEGIKGLTKDGKTTKYGLPDRDGLPGNDDDGWHWRNWMPDARVAFRQLWEQINGFGSWDANPWVWVIDFKRI